VVFLFLKKILNPEDGQRKREEEREEESGRKRERGILRIEIWNEHFLEYRTY
jgi:hypothetical protein